MRSEAPAARPLAGLRVLVTRPSPRGDALARAIDAAGGRATCFPVIAIGPAPDVAAARAVVARAGEHDLAVFVSASAVEAAARIASDLAPAPRWPRAVAVGPATRRALERQGFERVLAPEERFDSEGVLALDALSAPAIVGRSVLLVRGAGGRELIARTLVERGARVHAAVVYSRRLPDGDPDALRSRLARGEVDAAVVTSVEAAHNLFTLAGETGAGRLRRIEFVVLGGRIADALVELGVERPPRVAARAEDDALLAALAALVDEAPVAGAAR